MTFIFSDEDELFRQTAREWALDRLLPDFPNWNPDYAHEMAELGITGLRVPQEYGGGGGSFVQLGIAGEEISRGNYSANYWIQLNTIATELLVNRADEDLKRRWLPAIAAGEANFAFGLTEPGVGSDAASLTTTARIEGDEIVISGEKASITFAGFADVCIVFARTGGDGARGISSVLVPLDLPGVTRQNYDSMGSECTQRGSLFFDEVRVPVTNLLGEEGTGFIGAMTSFDFNRGFIALCCVGAAQQSLDETVEYTKTRETFGKPLARHEGISFQVAEHLAKIHSARLLGYEVMTLADAGLNHTKSAAMAKWLGPKLAAEAIHDCIVMHGWPGYGKDAPFDQRLRDVIGLEIGDGTPEIMKGIIARETYGREFNPYR